MSKLFILSGKYGSIFSYKTIILVYILMTSNAINTKTKQNVKITIKVFY